MKVSNRFENLEEQNEKSSWETGKEAIVGAAKKELTPPLKSKKHQKWMTDETLKLKDERRLYKGKDTKKFNEINIEIKTCKIRNPKEMFRSINDIAKKQYCKTG